jgi:Porphyromonas-type peptidyl-arginine deiminase
VLSYRTLLTTESCLLSKTRNPRSSRADIEHELRRRLGVTKIIWLPTGLKPGINPSNCMHGTWPHLHQTVDTCLKTQQTLMSQLRQMPLLLGEFAAQTLMLKVHTRCRC